MDDDESIRVALGGLLRSIGLRGESGLTLQQEIAKTGLQIPILFITGYGDIEMCVRAMKAGALDFIPTPFRDQDMLVAVSQALKRDVERRMAEAIQVAPTLPKI